MAWDVHAVSANDYQTTVEPCDENWEQMTEPDIGGEEQ